MSIVNRRNAVFGWVAWVATKRAVKRKARAALPGTVEGTMRPNKGAIAALVAVAVAVLWFWQHESSPDEIPLDETPLEG